WFFSNLSEFAKDNDLQLMPTRIITDFELAPINASHHEFPNAVQKAFFSAQEIPATFEILKEYYIPGKVRHRSRDGTVATRGLPLFLPSLWSIYDLIKLGVLRTQNVMEAWHHCWKTLVGGLNQNVETQIEWILRREQRPKPKRCFIEKEKRLMTVFND
ncbi:20819_t:CDS:2, partial [Cetraspora pellucida]